MAKARVGIQNIRVPVRKLHYPGLNKETIRTVTIGQVAVLLWHLYRCANDPEAGYLDASVDFNTLMNKQLNKTVGLSKETLERLLWAGNLAEQLGFWWSPDNKSFSEFITPLIWSGEVFDRTLNLLLDHKNINKIKNQKRFVRRIKRRKQNKKESTDGVE